MDIYFLSENPTIIIALQFLQKYVKMFKSTAVSINVICPPIIQVQQYALPKPLHSVYLTTHPPSIYKSNATINSPSIRYGIDF